MFEKVTICHLLPQRAGAGDKVVAGKEANWHGQVSGGHSRLCWRKATALQWVVRKQTPEDRGQFMGDRRKGVPVNRNMVRHQGKEKKAGLKKGKSWMLH